ncbi:MAG TPA: DUF1674 domain-containing protein [Xanthobacteraceae bacterium]|nr:DUF1674 domain-containing protein [Xanthobacteraceae bacterium]
MDKGGTSHSGAPVEPAANPSPISPAAQRALAEAKQRREELDRKLANSPKEFHGPKGPEPARYGDWEVKGIASDF